MLKGFRDFIMRGNVVDLAVAVVIGAAFGALVTSFTDDILMQAIAAVVGQPDFSDIVIGPIRIGSFLTALLNFLLIASAIYFFSRRADEPDLPRARACADEGVPRVSHGHSRGGAALPGVHGPTALTSVSQPKTRSPARRARFLLGLPFR